MLEKVIINKNTVTVTYVRLKVITCLYLSPKKRARSLSTLIAVTVNKDTEHKIYPVSKAASYAKLQIFHLSFTVDIQAVTNRGSKIIPTHRSVIARVRNKSLDGALSENSLCMESDQDQSVPQNYSNGQKTVYHWKTYQLIMNSFCDFR